MRGHEFEEEFAAAAKPLDGMSKNGVETYAGYVAYVAGGGIANPQFNGVGCNVLEDEALAIGGPQGHAGTGSGRELNRDLATADNLDQGEVGNARWNTVAAGGVVAAAVTRFQAHAGQFQIGLGNTGNGRIGLLGGLEKTVAGGVQARCWCQWCFERFEDVLWGVR
ncbi:hypothetical protein M233_08140 [Xylella fastidiosa subsp. multiplex Griffin-1]|nr:hypothetical protein M233_08140 [Xylella fastidiosa subsp. multiplex Griffin-1]OMK00836.1 hypothetical protein XYFPCFBP8417_02425 [Xylella fastidiosa subsp. multiplex]